MNRLKSVAIGLVVSGLFGCASAPDPAPPPHGLAEGRGEGRRGEASLFISPCGKPYRAGPGEPYPVAAWFAQADTNGDGRLSLAEFEADAAAFFHQLDQNGDGIVAGPEVTFYEERLVPEILSGSQDGALRLRPQFLLAQFGGGGGGGGGMGGGGGGRGSGRGQRGGGQSRADRPATAGPTSGRGAAPYGLLGEPEPVTAADADFNSLITAEEFKDAADRRFALLDPMGVGYLTLATLPKTPVQAAGGAGRRRRPSSAPA